MRLRGNLAILVFAGGILTCGTAQAAVIFGTGNPGNAGTDNVLFNSCTANVLVGLSVNGCLNSDHSLLVDFYNAGETLVADGGQARITAQDGAFSQLTFGFQDPSRGFTKAIFNINTTPGDTGTISITANLFGGGSASVANQALANGSNFFFVETNAGEIIDTISFVSSIGMSSVTFEDARQFRIGGQQAVPEPASLLLVASGLLIAARRIRRTA
jgi:hypothetical protein